MNIKSILFFSFAVTSGQAFISPSPSSTTSTTTTTTTTALRNSIADQIQTSFKIAQESNAAGYGFKQVLADVLAGNDYDKDAISNAIEETIASAPCGMYSSAVLFIY